MFDSKEKRIHAVLNSEEVKTLEFDENGKSQVVRLTIGFMNSSKIIARNICVLIDYPSSVEIETQEALDGTYSISSKAYVGSTLIFKRLTIKNDLHSFHPINMDWILVKLGVRFTKKDYPENIVWTTTYANDLPETLNGIRYMIKGNNIAAYPLQGSQKEIDNIRKKQPDWKFIEKTRIESGILRKVPELTEFFEK
ncbi:MAG: hypothetical protein V3V84_03465 [Candidatus Bathyarchaeia archaeon]